MSDRTAAPAAGTPEVDVDALEEAMEEVVETLDLAEQAADLVETRSPDPRDRARAAAVRRQAEAMLDAAGQAAGNNAAGQAAGNDSGAGPPAGRHRPDGTLH